jgi:hypothetical protein
MMDAGGDRLDVTLSIEVPGRLYAFDQHHELVSPVDCLHCACHL